MIERVRMRHFRRFDDETVNFGSGVNLIEGVNNSGKSTILYAIEYGLFGHVRGFKKKSEYTTRGEPDAGVELIFNGNDGNRYRLLRFHKIGKGSRVSSSYFTLKRFVSDKDGEGEEYVLSSDFGDTEEHLALKVRELIGMSRRLFEVTVSARQGELPDLLKGSDALDIVLGVTAADALTEAFRERKRDLEKNLSQLPILESLLERLNSEKEQIESEGKKIDDYIKVVSDTVKELKGTNAAITTLGSSIDSLDSIRSSWESAKQQLELSAASKSAMKDQLEKKKYTGSLESWKAEMAKAEERYQKAVSDLDEHRTKNRDISSSISEAQGDLGNQRGRLSSLVSSIGTTVEELEGLGETLGTKKKIEKDLAKSKKDLQDLIDERESIQYQVGDLEGQLSRRKDVQGAQTCEYCGAELDAVKVKAEITKLTKDLKALKSKDTKAEKNIDQTRTKISDLETGFSIIDALELKKSVAQAESKLAALQKDNAKLEAKTEELIRAQADARNEADTKKAAFDEISELVQKLESYKKQEKSMTRQLADAKKDLQKIALAMKKEVKATKFPFSEKVSKSLDAVDLKSEAFPPEFREIEQVILENRAEVRVKLEREQSTLTDLKRQKEDHGTRTMQIDNEISNTTSQLDNLTQMKTYVEKYERLSGAFKEVQSQIRETASVDLSKTTLQLHQDIFPESEVTDVRIRPEDYSVEVCPKDWDEMVPATVYQGGGMQLLLGIAYRMAIGDFVRGVPFLFADEPTYGADVENRKKVLSSFQKMSMTPQTLLVTHQSDSLEFIPNNRVEILMEGDRSVVNTTSMKSEPEVTPKKKTITKKTAKKKTPVKKTAPTKKKSTKKGGVSK